MRKLRAAFVGIVLAVPAALALPGAVPAAAAAQCPGTLNTGSFSVSMNTPTNGTTGTTLDIVASIPGLSTFNVQNGGTAIFIGSNGSPNVSVPYSAISATELHVQAPANGYSGAVQICISGNSYSGAVTPQRFSYRPEVLGVPAATEGQTINIAGKFLNGVSATVNFACGGVPSAGTSLTAVTVTVPHSYCPGPVTVTQTAYDGTVLNGTVSSSLVIKPVFSSMSPGGTYPGQTVTVTGSGFGGGGSVSVGGAGANLTGWNDGSVSFQAPDGSEGGDVSVNAPGGSVSAGGLSILPHISSLSPASAKDGDTVTVSGQDFGSSPGTVTLGGQPLEGANVSGWGMDRVTFVVPAGAVPGAVGVTTADGHQSVNTSNLSLVPVISSVSPTQAAPGSYVTISGSTFGQNPGSVTIGGKTAQIADWADTAIIALVPSGASTGKLIVNSGYGTSVAWGQNFIVLGGGAASGSGGSGGYSGYTNSGTMNVTPNYGFLPLPKAPPGVAFHLTAPATDVKPGAPVALTVNLQINGKAVAGATITFQVASSPGEGTALSAPSAVTDQNGVAHVTLTTSKKPGQTIVIAHSGAFADQIRILTLFPTAALGGLGTTILRTTNTLDPHILFPFIGALVLAVLLLLGTVILQFVLHRRSRGPVPAAASAATVVAEATAVLAEPPAAVSGEPAAKPRKPRAPRARKPALAPTGEAPEQSEPIALGLAAGAEDIAPVIPLRPADQQPEPKITRTRARAKARE